MSTTIRTASTTLAPSIRRSGPASHYRRVERPCVARRPNYVLRRCVAAFVSVGIVLIVAVVLNGLLASFGGRSASAAEARPVNVSAFDTTYVAQPGDSLWSIASDHRGNVDHGAYIDELVRINGDTAIVVGQAVILP
jgi:LysM domain